MLLATVCSTYTLRLCLRTLQIAAEQTRVVDCGARHRHKQWSTRRNKTIGKARHSRAGFAPLYNNNDNKNKNNNKLLRMTNDRLVLELFWHREL